MVMFVFNFDGSYSMNNYVLPMYYLAQIKEQLDCWQLDSHKWLSQNNISYEQLLDTELNIDYKLFEGLITSALHLSDNPALGLYVGQRMGLTSHGMLGYAMLNSENLREAMAIFKEFINTRTPLVTIDTVETADEFSIVFKEVSPLNDIKQTFLEALFVTFTDIISQLSHGDVTIKNIAFDFDTPSYFDQYRPFFDCPVNFAQAQSKITLDKDQLDTRLKMSNASTLKQAKQICEAELIKMRSNNQQKNLTKQITEMFITSVGHYPSLETTAARFHMTPRTLHRHLHKEGSSYKEILDQVILTISIEYLTQTELPVQEIAWLLGYMDVANFRRSFKRLTGVPPSSYRNKGGINALL